MAVPPTDPAGPDLRTPAGRVAWLLEHVFAGAVRRMAEELGVSHAVLSKVVNGRQGPGRRLLEAVAAHPKVNPAWLYDGRGEPLLAPADPAPAPGRSLPVASTLLPGPPAEHAALMTGETMAVMEPLFSPWRYWVRVLDSDLILVFERRVAVYDLLLVDTEPLWREAPARLAGRLCAVRRRSAAGHAMAWARAGRRAGASVTLEVLGEEQPPPPPAPTPARTSIPARSSSGAHRRGFMGFGPDPTPVAPDAGGGQLPSAAEPTSGDTAPGQDRVDAPSATPAADPTAGVDDVVGVVVLLIRHSV